MITKEDFIERVASEKKPTFVSTGMTTYAEIDRAVDIFTSLDLFADKSIYVWLLRGCQRNIPSEE